MNAGNSNAEDDVQEIVERMRSVRSSGVDYAGKLHGEAMRLVDWKEYVRAKPLVSIAAASLMGFTIMRGTMRASHGSALFVSSAKQPLFAARTMKSNFASGVLAIATSIASSAMKNYFAKLSERMERSNLEGGSNDRFRHVNAKDPEVA